MTEQDMFVYLAEWSRKYKEEIEKEKRIKTLFDLEKFRAMQEAKKK